MRSKFPSTVALLLTVSFAAVPCLAAAAAPPAAKAPIAAPAPATAAPDPAAYRKKIEAWRQERVADLKKEDSWLTLVGLYWLHPGANRFGSNPANHIILPAGPGKAPAYAGNLTLNDKTVKLTAQPGVALLADGKPAAPGTVLKSDTTGKPTVVQLGSLSFYVIQREEKLGVRIKDKASPLLASFKGLDDFPLNPDWRVVARFEPAKDKKIAIANVLGQVADQKSPGTVVFERGGKTYRLDALEGGPKGELFLIFADQTNGRETYGAGRFLETDAPQGGKVVVDFNTAYNPPCAFTAFATCPLPPQQNKLAVKVEAGEKKFAGGHS
jgi:uncharacterized protein (DUF1684 family)